MNRHSSLRKFNIFSLITFFWFLTIASTTLAASSTLVKNVNTSQKVIALTIDDGYDRNNYSNILQILDKHGVKATFFINGQAAENNAQLVKDTSAKGHEFGNHTYSHPNLKNVSSAEVKAQLSRSESVIRNLTGRTTKPYFRPPYGSYNSNILNIAGSEGYAYRVYWSIDTDDWRGNSADSIYNVVMKQLKPGAIVLAHTNKGAKNTAAALDRIIPAVKSKGYQFVLLSQMLGRPSTPVAKPSPGPNTGSGSKPSTSGTYTVKKGDTLSKIARQFHTTVAKIAQANHIKNVNRISVGQKLQIPGTAAAPKAPAPKTPASKPVTKAPVAKAGKTYTVKRGDTLFSIAKRHKTTVSRLASVNKIKNINLIRVNQVLNIQ